jgi:hypothetical protein
MARHQPSQRATSGEPFEGKIVMRRDADGKLQAVEPEGETVTTTESAERPPTPDDPRAASDRNLPGYAG